jgi:hypothetical protein
MELLLRSGVSELSILLQRVMRYCLLSAEVLVRLSDCQDIGNGDFEPFARIVMQAMMHYQWYQIACEECWLARRAILVTLQSFLGDPQVLVAFFESQYLMDGYLLFVFESASGPIMLTALFDYLVHDQAVKGDAVMNK